jgi:hypothetical protein
VTQQARPISNQEAVICFFHSLSLPQRAAVADEASFFYHVFFLFLDGDLPNNESLEMLLQICGILNNASGSSLRCDMLCNTHVLPTANDERLCGAYTKNIFTRLYTH